MLDLKFHSFITRAVKPHSKKTSVDIVRVHLFGKILIRILNPKTDFLFLWQNPKGDYESNESVRDEDSMD